jgi:hypothetical protein
MGLRVNEKKKTWLLKNDKNLEFAPCLYIDGQKFESVHRFIYLGLLVNYNNDISEELRRQIQNLNRCCYGLRKHFKSRLLTHETEIRLYITLVRPVSAYGCETWMLTKADELALSTFERKVLRKIYGPVCGREEWRIRYNHELYQLYKTPNITRVIKITRLRWAGHLQRMSDNEIPRRIMECKPEGRSSVGLPRL